MENKTAFIFPAFITEFTSNELEFLQQNLVDFNSYLNKISVAININIPEFNYDSNDYLENELYSQLLAYTFSCAFNDILNSKSLVPDFIAGYSMGIYASLYAAKSINFEEGAELIFKAYHLVEELSQTGEYSMGAIIGLSIQDIEALIKKNSSVEIININNEHSQVIAGKKDQVILTLNKAKEEGAISTTELTVNAPYHSKFLLEYAEAFAEYIDAMQINPPETPIISTFDQRIITNAEDIKLELVFNLTQKISWYDTMINLIENGVTEMYECGAGKDLKKISRFIKGDYKIKSIYKI